MSYTKGKNGTWYTDKFVSGKAVFCDGAALDGGRTVIAIPQKQMDGNDNGNAALIAAAPDLLEACKKVLNKCREIDDKDIPAPLFNLIENNIYKAIQKAEAEE